MPIETRITEIVDKFEKVADWESKYSLIIEMGKSLDPLSASEQVEGNKIKGCQSQVWLAPSFTDGVVFFKGDSDASIVKGIVAILLYIYSGSTPDEILNTKQTFIDEIGLKEHLSMTRANGLASMLKQITMYGMAFKAKANMGNS